jgi:hypothetical protein
MSCVISQRASSNNIAIACNRRKQTRDNDKKHKKPTSKQKTDRKKLSKNQKKEEKRTNRNTINIGLAYEEF